MPLELKKILAAKSPDIQLQADDIIFVPGSAAKGAAKRGLEAIIQAATGLAIYHPYELLERLPQLLTVPTNGLHFRERKDLSI
jgi:hypothetical protein